MFCISLFPLFPILFTFFRSCIISIFAAFIIVRVLRIPTSPLFYRIPAGTATLSQRCHNVVVDVVTTLSQGRCWRCHNVVARLKMRIVPTSVSDVVTTSLSNVVKTLTQRCYNVATRLSTGFLGLFDEDYSDLFPFIKTRDSYKIAKWHQTHIVSL